MKASVRRKALRETCPCWLLAVSYTKRTDFFRDIWYSNWVEIVLSVQMAPKLAEVYQPTTLLSTFTAWRHLIISIWNLVEHKQLSLSVSFFSHPHFFFLNYYFSSASISKSKSKFVLSAVRLILVVFTVRLGERERVGNLFDVAKRKCNHKKLRKSHPGRERKKKKMNRTRGGIAGMVLIPASVQDDAKSKARKWK